MAYRLLKGRSRILCYGKVVILGVVGAMVLSACGFDTNAGVTTNSIQESESTEYAMESEERDDSVSLVTDVELEKSYTESGECAVIHGLDKDGNVVWTRNTATCELTELDNICPIGIQETFYYYVEGGSVIALNLSDGEKVWENKEFKGASLQFLFGEDSTLYLCGYYGPSFFAVDKDGNTLANISAFEEEYCWPDKLERVGEYIEVTVYDNIYTNTEVFRVDLSDYSYERVEQQSDTLSETPVEEQGEYLSDEQLCELARIYYEKTTSSPAPEYVQVDGESGNMVYIWLYQDFGDHVATMDWYTVDRYTGKGQNTLGETIDLLNP
ncbi:MAG: hypothetical protein ACI4DO_08415 [Roseburia sp.]